MNNVDFKNTAISRRASVNHVLQASFQAEHACGFLLAIVVKLLAVTSQWRYRATTGSKLN
jgi:hypothetical protein